MITMGVMSNSIKKQNIVGLDPRENLITPLDAVPLLGGAAKVGRGATLMGKGIRTVSGSYHVGLNYIRTSRFGIGQLLVGGKTIQNIELGARAIYMGGDMILTGVTGGLAGYHLVHKNSIRIADILDPKNQSRGLDTSLTSVSKGPGTGTSKKRAKRPTRTLSPRLSKGDNVNRSSRRKTTYCNVHKKYDFCKYYKR